MIYVRRLANDIAEVFAGVPRDPTNVFTVDEIPEGDGMLKINENGEMYIEPYPEPVIYEEPEPEISPNLKAFIEGINSI